MILLLNLMKSGKHRLDAARSFRSDEALEAIAYALEEKIPNVVLYNYPSFSGAYSALFALASILLISSVVPFRISSADLTAYGNSHFQSRLIDAKKLLKFNKAFKIRLGRGFYGECLGMRADGNHQLSDELGKQLSLQSAASVLRPIGALTFMQRNNHKMCLRITDNIVDISEIAKKKAYGGVELLVHARLSYEWMNINGFWIIHNENTDGTNLKVNVSEIRSHSQIPMTNLVITKG
ncbi:unnamed protein product [Arabis nemorensis]|uniref:Uncharacterized protein n=1 Tax=Arabis nemorensis TaxID=586526 RepID=A0A565BJH6_9BRAS|nr:unnamed protein product [Arabis nemorensis]